MKSRLFTCLGVTALLVLASLGTAHAVTIDFEKFPGPDGLLGTGDDIPIAAPSLFSSQPDQLTDDFATLGILFTPDPALEDKNEILNDSSFTRSVGSSSNLLSTNRLAHPDFGPIDAIFTVPVNVLTMAIGLSIGAAEPNILEIYDAGDSLIDSIIATDAFVTLVSAVPIARFQVRATEPGEQAAIDDITFRVVPEPSSVILAGLGLSLIAIRRRR